jgi:2-succinyl-5-enolpyruvyl-6-hydroxy-3-cyclohexene-1-carboxylate synthase
MIVSKRIKAFEEIQAKKHHWHIDTLRAYDTFGILTSILKWMHLFFFDAFLPLTKPL